MHSPIKVYDTEQEITGVVAYHHGQLNGHPLPRHQRTFHALLVALTESTGGIPTGLIQRYGKPFETYSDPSTGEQMRSAIRRAVEGYLHQANIDIDQVMSESTPVLDAA